MIQVTDNTILNHLVQVSQVNHIARIRVGSAYNSYLEPIVVAMPVGIVAGPENRTVPLV